MQQVENAPEPPADDHVQVVVMGRGVGESLLVHLPGGTWFVVDSFVGRMTAADAVEPAAIAYLRALSLEDPHVSGIYLTHLHADHAEGIKSLVAAFGEARLRVPLPVPAEQLDRVLDELITEEGGPLTRSAISQVSSAIRIAGGRFDVVAANVADPDEAIGPLTLIAPAVAAKHAAADWSSAAFKGLARSNMSSIVLWVEVDQAKALLTGDMEEADDFGWPKLIEERSADARIGRAGLIKVPHHGSEPAQLPEMYERFTDGAKAIVTPNIGSKLPKGPGVTAITGRVAELWISGRPDHAELKGNDLIYWVTATADPSVGEWSLRARFEPLQQMYPVPAT